MKILVLNSGSSSQKSALFDMGPEPSESTVAPRWEAKLDWDGSKQTLTIRNSIGKQIRDESQSRPEDRQVSVEKMLQNIWSGETAVLRAPGEIEIVGHRIVHGGSKLTAPVVVTSQVKHSIAEVAAIAPLHNQAGLNGIELIEKLLPGIPQIAVFDTGFHQTLPQYAKVYPGPYTWYEQGIRRYGFHGINHQYCAHRSAQLVGRDVSSLKIISCHLGNGCSLAAIDSGKSIDTTMGFTPLEGLMMGTRSGSIDPGIFTHLVHTGTSPDRLDDILNHESGLLGISGVSSDMRDVLEAARAGKARANLAFDIFIHRLQSGIGAMAASLGGLDALVFTAGIGENSAEVRASTCTKLGFLGIELNDANNSSAQPDTDISNPGARIRVLVIRAQEDWAIARECVELS